jgi:putative membrane protein
MMSYFGGFGWMGLLGWSTMLLFWIGVILLAVWIVRTVVGRDRRSEADIAKDVLQRRYAAGEISEAEYQQALRTLGSN